jgi:hypothetical protein
MSRLNEKMIETMVNFARRPGTPPPAYSIVTPLRERLRQLDACARRRLAELPFLLIDLRFTDELTWGRLLQSPTSSLDRKPRRTADEVRAIALARGVTVLAWHIVHSQPESASLHLGISEAVAMELRRADLLNLDHAAIRIAGACRPRWPDRPSAWLYLMKHAEHASDSMRNETVYALQLLGADMVCARSRGSGRLEPDPL